MCIDIHHPISMDGSDAPFPLCVIMEREGGERSGGITQHYCYSVEGE